MENANCDTAHKRGHKYCVDCLEAKEKELRIWGYGHQSEFRKQPPSVIWLWEQLYKDTPKHLVMNYEFVKPMFEGLYKALTQPKEK